MWVFWRVSQNEGEFSFVKPDDQILSFLIKCSIYKTNQKCDHDYNVLAWSRFTKYQSDRVLFGNFEITHKSSFILGLVYM